METTWKKNTHKYFTDPAKRNGYYPLISSYEGELVNLFCSENPLNNKISSISLTQDSIVENEDDYIIESDNEQQIYETDLAYLHGVLNKVYIIKYKFFIFINWY